MSVKLDEVGGDSFFEREVIVWERKGCEEVELNILMVNKPPVPFLDPK